MREHAGLPRDTFDIRWVNTGQKWTERDSSVGNPCHLKIARPSSTSSSRNFHVRDVEQLGHWKDDNDCPDRVKAVDWRKPKSFQFLQSRVTSLSREREQCSTMSSLSSARGAEARALDEGVCVTPETVRGPRRTALAS